VFCPTSDLPISRSFYLLSFRLPPFLRQHRYWLISFNKFLLVRANLIERNFVSALKSSLKEPSLIQGEDFPINSAKENPMTIRSSVLANMIGWPGAAWAPLTVAPAGNGGAPASSEDSDLNSFAVAAVKVHRINNAYTRKIEAAKSDPEKQQLEQQANGEMVKAVRNEGLTVDAYQAIASRLHTDHALAERVKQKIKKVA